ncbi:TIGR00270 family protein [Candidatus Woesearchaeota archaeon]|nr:TIGR00270 family protein [Candidatus Woesearchaeota archaeon]
MQCDMCGAQSQLFRAEVEGVELNVCQSCSKFGNVIEKAKSKEEKKVEEEKLTKRIVQLKKQKEESPERVVADYGKIIRGKRESMGLKQEDFARKLSEKVSVIQKMEIGAFKPSISLVRKLEKILGVALVEKPKVDENKQETVEHDLESKEFTIGDFVKYK